MVRLADKFAYIHHDVDDAIRGGILSEEDIPLAYRKILGMNGKERLSRMIHDVITSSMNQPEIRMSDAVSYTHLDVYKRQMQRSLLQKEIA